MKGVFGWLIIAGLALVSACAAPPKTVAPVEQGGWLTYSESRIRVPIACGPTPIQLTGDHIDTRLTGGCRHVRITGQHNDIEVEVAPGGTIEILGSNTDVFWSQAQPGAPPRLINSGVSNTFHKR